MGDWGWNIPPYPGRPPDLRTLLYGFRWPLLVVLVVINGLGGHWAWTTWKTHAFAASFAAGLGAIGLILLDLVAGVLALYVWWGRRQ